MTTSMKHLFLLLLLLTSTAHAATLGVHVGSHHFPSKDTDNNQNLGLYVRGERVGFGMYRSTIRRNSMHLDYSIERGPFAVTAGVVSNYQRKNGVGHSRGYLSPLFAVSVAGPSVAGITPRLSFVPGGLIKVQNLVHLSLERPL